MKRLIQTLCLLILCLHAGACTPVTAQRGNMLEDYQIGEVETGKHMRSDVLRILGSPTTVSTFNANVWYYIGQETAKKGILDDQVTKERIVAITFDQDGLVQSIQDVDGQRLDIPYTRAKTPTYGNDLTFTQQLLGNLGRFNAPAEE